MAKCPFKKTTHIRSYEHEETFGYCQSDCMAGFLREDGTFGCVFIERYKPLVIEGEDFYEVGNSAELESRLNEIWRQGPSQSIK
jgi:hypothetical protein